MKNLINPNPDELNHSRSWYSESRPKTYRKASSSIPYWADHREAFRLVNATEHSEIPNYCADAQLDFAYVTPNKKLSEFGLVVMDMDSTLIAIESIDEIAALCNVKQQVAEITTSTMRGEIDFPKVWSGEQPCSKDFQKIYCSKFTIRK